VRELIWKLLGVERFGSGDADVRFEMARGFPAWAWALAIVALALVAWWSYARLTGPRPARIALATLRAAFLALILWLAAGPQLVRQPERVERDWVVVLADRSRSLTVADAPGGPGGGRQAREAQLREALRDAQPTMDALARERNLLWLGFDSGAYPLGASGAAAHGVPAPPSEPDLEAPTGRRTAIGRAIEQALLQVAARPVSGIVILSDGRSADQVPRPVLRRLEAEQIPVFAVPLGSAGAVPDYAVARAEAPSVAFINDVVPVNAEIAVSGVEGSGALPARVELVDSATGLVLDSRRLDDAARLAGQPAKVTLSGSRDRAGKAAWRLRVVPDVPDLSPDNNAAEVPVELVDRPLRVVYIDGYPRWEYRFLKTLLVREESVRSSVMLLAADKQYIQEGSELLAAMPSSPGEWAGVDIVILGDVRAELFGDEQMRQIRELVSLRGAGLLWIGGPGATPGSYRGRALADLLPFTLDARAGGESESGIHTYSEPVVLRPTPSAARLGLLRLGEAGIQAWPAELSDPRLGWPTFHWAQRIAPQSLKPTAEVLADAIPASEAGSAAGGTPLVLTMRYGAGRSAYVATDEIWRWRYARGETLTERFWLPLLRYLARESLGRSGKRAMLEASPDRALVEQPVRLTIRLLDQELIEARAVAPSVALRVTRQPDRVGAVAEPGITVSLVRESPGVFSATWIAPEPGTYRLESSEAVLAGLGLSAVVEVAAPDDELRRPQADHAFLGTLADATGGRILTADRLADLPSLLPNRQVRLLGAPEIETLWDKWAMLAALMALVTIEWLGRKWIRLA